MPFNHSALIGADLVANVGGKQHPKFLSSAFLSARFFLRHRDSSQCGGFRVLARTIPDKRLVGLLLGSTLEVGFEGLTKLLQTREK